MKIKTAKTQQEKLAIQFHKVDNLFHRIRRVNKINAKAEKADKVSIHRGQGRVLALLTEEGDLSIAQLVESLDIRPSSASELVKKLEQQGYVTRTVSEDDKRVSILSITPEGKSILEKTGEVNADYFEEMFSGLDSNEQEQLSTLLDKLVTSLKAKGEAKDIKLDDTDRRRKTRHSHRHCA